VPSGNDDGGLISNPKGHISATLAVGCQCIKATKTD
jgi:hypothetical protein